MKTYTPNSHYFDDDVVLCVDVIGHDGNVSALQFAGGDWRHSPTGYSWGYSGSGCAELARAILADHVGAEVEPAIYQDFKNDKIATLDEKDREWKIIGGEISAWLRRHAYKGTRHAKT